MQSAAPARPSHPAAVLLLVLMATMPLTAGGCSTGGGKTGRAAATRTVDSLERVQETLVDGRDELYAVSAHLAEAVAVDAGTDADTEAVVLPADLEPAGWFKGFTRQRADTRKLAQRLTRDLQRLRSERDAYVAGWETDLSRVTDPELRQMSRERRRRIDGRFSDLTDGLSETEQQMTPLLEQLDNLHLYLSNDLTAAGFVAVQGRIEKAAQTAAVLGDRYDDLSDDVVALTSDVAPRLTQ